MRGGFLLVWPLCLLLALYPPLAGAGEKARHYVISSGSAGGNYHKAGRLVADLLGGLGPGLLFVPVPSEGSIDNVERLKTRFADFAIVQQDVLMNSLHRATERINNITLLFPLFQEKFIIYTHLEGPVSFERFRERVNEGGKRWTIGIPGRGGTADETLSLVAALLGFDLRSVERVYDDYSNLIDGFLREEIDYLVTLSLPIEELEERGTSVVHFDEGQIALLRSRMRDLSKAELGRPDHFTLGVWSYLVGLDSSIDDIGEERIVDSLFGVRDREGFIAAEIMKTLERFGQDGSWYHDHLSAAPVSHHLLERLGHGEGLFTRYFFPVAGVAVLVVVLYVMVSYLQIKDLVDGSGRSYLRLRYRYFAINFFIVLVLYFGSVAFLIHFEKALFEKSAVKGEILDMSYFDVHFWNLIRMFTTNDGGVFPLSSEGKVLVTFSSYTILIGGIFLILSEIAKYRLFSRRRRGLMDVTFVNHIVIAGWNDYSVQLVDRLLHALEFEKRRMKVVFISDDPERISRENEHIEKLVDRRLITFVKGNVRQKRALEQANAHRARIVVFLADDDTVQSDERTLLRVLSFSRYCRERSVGDGYCGSVYMIAQVNDSELVEDFHNAGVNGIIDKGDVIDGILVQTILNPGVSKLLNNILSYSHDTNEFYTIDLSRRENAHLRGKTFDELLLPLRIQGILLVAIRIVYMDENGTEIVDESEIRERLEGEGLLQHRQIMTNPISEEENRRRTGPSDQLLVLCVNPERLEEGVRAAGKLFRCEPESG